MSALGLTTRYSLERRTCGCTMHVSATGRFVLAADYDALITRLRAAESERDDLRCEVEALQAERDTARLEAGRLRARLRAAEARIERVGAILSDEGCDCYCDCDSDGHNADCDLCLACRIDREVSP